MSICNNVLIVNCDLNVNICVNELLDSFGTFGVFDHKEIRCASAINKIIKEIVTEQRLFTCIFPWYHRL